MEINLTQHLFARDIPGKLVLIGFPAALVFASFHYAKINLTSLHSIGMWGWLLLVIAICIPLGCLIGAVFISIFLAPIYQVAIRRNGGPFCPGDTVYVISGKHKGLITTVYSCCQGLAVHISVGEKEENTSKDIVSTLNIVKMKNGAEQSVPGYPPQSVGSPEP